MLVRDDVVANGLEERIRLNRWLAGEARKCKDVAFVLVLVVSHGGVFPEEASPGIKIIGRPLQVTSTAKERGSVDADAVDINRVAVRIAFMWPV
jgi:hypothetical protein